MPRYVALAKIFFDDADGGTEGWAQGQAQWLKDNTQALAAQARLVNPGTAAEETSYCGNFRVEDDGTLTPVSAWHMDNAGTVQEGMPVASAEPVAESYPEWVQPTGAHDAYAIDDIVTHNGSVWINTFAGNSYEPGVYGWDLYSG